MWRPWARRSSSDSPWSRREGWKRRARTRSPSLAAQQHDNPFLHGLAHKLVAQVALASREHEVFVEHLTAMARWFRGTENPALVSQCHRLAEEGRSGGVLVAETGVETTAAAERDRGAARVRDTFRNCQSPAECLETALSTLIEASGADQGYLYLRVDDNLEYAAPLVGTAPPDELRQQLTRVLLAQDARGQQARPPDPDTPLEFEDDGEATELLAAGYETIQLATLPDPRPLRAMPLYAGEGANQSCIGIVALLEDDAPLRTPNPYLVEEVVRGIQSTEEVKTVYLGSQSS